MTAYTVLAGADFGAGLWTLLAVGGSARARRIRDEARHAMGPVWEANHVWLIFVLVIAWTAYPVAYGSITSTLARSEEHTSELQSHVNLVCRLLLEKKK